MRQDGAGQSGSLGSPQGGLGGREVPPGSGGSPGGSSPRGKILIGTSGWQYRDWRGPFYPPEVPQRRWLEHYARQFATVENNGTFYRLPPRETFAGWRERVGGDFVMTVKASRYLTHVRRLRDPAEPVRRLLDAAAGLGGRLGAVLLQLPPDLRAAPRLLDECLARFPAGIRVAVEPRHESWWTDQVRDVLAARNAALCWADRTGTAVTPRWRTADWGYLRCHEGDDDDAGRATAPPRCAPGRTGSSRPGRRAWTCTSTSTTTSGRPRPATRRASRPPSPPAAAR